MENRVKHILEKSGLWKDLGGITDNLFNFNFSCCVVAEKGWCDPRKRETFSNVCRFLHQMICPILSKLGYNVS